MVNSKLTFESGLQAFIAFGCQSGPKKRAADLKYIGYSDEIIAQIQTYIAEHFTLDIKTKLKPRMSPTDSITEMKQYFYHTK